MEFTQKIKILKCDEKSFKRRDGNMVEYRQLTIVTSTGDILRISPLKAVKTVDLLTVADGRETNATFVIESTQELLPKLKLKSI